MPREEKERRVPKLRFKGFTDDWMHRPIRNLGEINPTSSLPQTFKYVDLESVTGTRLTHYQEVTIDSAPSRAKRLAQKGDIFYQTVRPYQKNNFYFEKDDKNFVFSSGYAQIRPYGIKGIFLFYKLQNNDFVNEVLRKSTGTSYPAINSNDLSNIRIYFPQSNIEQEYIGRLLEELDRIITLEQKKTDALNSFKKYLLNNLYVNKAVLPLLRFQGFTGLWMQRRLSEVATHFDYGLNSAAQEYDGVNKYLRITDIDEDTRDFKADDLKSPSGNLKNKDDYLLSEGDIVFARTGASVGKTYMYKPEDEKVYYAGYLIRVRVNENNSTSFIFYNTLTAKYRNFVQITSQRSGQPGINATEYKNYKMHVPSKKEQNKIGRLLKTVDKLIGLEKAKLEKYSNAKELLLSLLYI